MSDTITQEAPAEPAEARAVLADMAHERFGATPPELLAEHVLATHPGAAWPVLREAMDALRRRFAFAERDGLAVARRPAGRVLGEYATRAQGRRERPYRTVLASVRPLRGSCGCADFRRGGLGLCKHLLVVLDALARKPRTWARATAEEPAANARLAWNPVRPLVGADDWLERVRFDPGATPRGRWPKVARRFAAGVGAEWVLQRTHAGEPERRLALVRELVRGADATDDPGLAERLAEEERDLARELLLARRRERMQAELRRLKRKLYRYQREGVASFLARGRLLLADDMGLGKTVQAIAACHALFGAGVVRRGLLVVPAPLKHQWRREWRATSDAPVDVVEGSRDERAALYARTRRGFLIANYEQLLRDLDVIRAWEPELCVLDEAQRIKNWAAKTSHAVKSLRPEYRLVLTGTPMENRLEELASVVEWVDDHALEPKWRLVPVHALRADGERSAVGVRGLDTLRARLAPCTVRRVRSEVIKQLPRRTDTQVPIELTAAQRELHAELDVPIASLLGRTERRSLTQEEFLRLMRLLLRQRQICNGLALAEFEEVWPGVAARRPTERVLASLDSPKLVELRALVESLVVDQGRKVVVFSQWRRQLELAAWAVSDVLAAAGLRALFFTGGEDARRRERNVVDFHDDPAARVLLATDAGGVGLNLQRAASACVLFELPWNPAVLEQRVGRIHRMGQKEPVQVYALVSEGGIEERIASLVADKQALFRGLFDGGSDEVLFDRSTSFVAGLRSMVGAAPEVPEAEEDPDEPAAAEPAAREPAHLGAGGVAAVFAGLRVDRTDGGGVRIEAPPESADALVAMLEGLLGALRRE